MRSKTTWMTLALAALVAPALATFTHAAHSEECSPHVPSDAMERTYPVYVTIDRIMTGYLFEIWIYAEANGIDALQRDDDSCYTTDANGAPYTRDTADMIIF